MTRFKIFVSGKWLKENWEKFRELNDKEFGDEGDEGLIIPLELKDKETTVKFNKETQRLEMFIIGVGFDGDLAISDVKVGINPQTYADIMEGLSKVANRLRALIQASK